MQDEPSSGYGPKNKRIPMLKFRQTADEPEPEPETIDEVLLDAIRGIVYESHEELVDYDDEMEYEETGRSQSGSSGGGGTLPLLLVGVAFGAIGYMLGKRSSSSGQMGGGTSGGIGSVTDKAADRTQEMAESTADRIREGGEQVSERTEEMSDEIEERSQEVGDEVEEKGSEASDEMEDDN